MEYEAIFKVISLIIATAGTTITGFIFIKKGQDRIMAQMMKGQKAHSKEVKKALKEKVSKEQCEQYRKGCPLCATLKGDKNA
jgi:hypothetical protein